MKDSIIKQIDNMFVSELPNGNHYRIGFVGGTVYTSACYSFYSFAQESRRGIKTNSDFKNFRKQTNEEFIIEFKRLMNIWGKHERKFG